MRFAGVLCLLAAMTFPSACRAQAQVPVFVITPEKSTVKFFVKSSVAIACDFNKRGASLTFKSTDVSTGVLDIKIQADSVDTGRRVAHPSTPPKQTPLNCRVPHSRRRRGCGFRRSRTSRNASARVSMARLHRVRTWRKCGSLRTTFPLGAVGPRVE